MSTYLTRRGCRRNNSNDLPDLFSYRVAAPPPNRVVQKLAHRFGLSIDHAITVASLAGLGSAVDR
jgi:hypothetical protein